ncbi:bifunctional diguanylate cyclase/phosphodiesterase [Burkholderia sp. SRS-W-2-2016]|uniref:putative bifunctional diguanylate cyclase/phosphodiesterase n=1 Tax=Burkholderia sp. SRS-W-2-2016 TaxID=1926878 RepID=UPI0015BD48DE|nr:EAL domain-containing protein [Burkholderia sp. SRS-W-2-2016]
MQPPKHSLFGRSGLLSRRVDAQASALGPDVTRKAGTLIAVLAILAVIATSTFLALRQSSEQDSALRTIQASGRLRHDLDQLQQLMLDEHAILYTSIATVPLYKRAAYNFPMSALLALTRDARESCSENHVCVSRLSELDDMIGRLSELSFALARKVADHPGSVVMGDPQLEEIDAYFYNVLERVVDVRLSADAKVDSVVSKSSLDAKWFTRVLLGCGVVAALLLISLIRWNGRIGSHLRRSLHLTEEVRSRYQRFFEGHPLPIWVTDDQTQKIIAANASAQRDFGYTEQQLLGMSLNDLRVEQVLGQLPQLRERRIEQLRHATQSAGIWVYRTRAGNRLSMEVHHLRIELDGRPATMAVMVDVTTLIQYHERLEHQARYDALTELPNRVLLGEYLGESLLRAAATGQHVSVLFLDLDRFKEVNDSLGHRIGDLLLKAVARRLQRLLRATDFVARYGGDEFVIVAERSDAAQLTDMLDRLIREMSEPYSIGEHELYLEVSIGVSTSPQDGAKPDLLTRNADAALYVAKSRGRNRYQFYKPELSRAVADKLRLTTRLRRAAKANELRLVYQPQIDMETGCIVGAEALLRWHDSELGEVSPAVFIPLAEETGLIQSIGTWVLRQACLQAKAWVRAGLPAMRVSVNVSPLQLERTDLPGVVRAALDEAGWPAQLLELEVTEGALMRNAEEAQRVLRELRALGVSIAIDDFGTGYSSLSYLKRFSVDRIKIDRAFVCEIGKDSELEALSLAIIAIAETLSFDVVAEGVELEAQREFLVRHGCSVAQGFLFSPAVSPEDLARMLGDTAVAVS